MPLTLPDFVARWQASTRTERSGAQEHFLDLCDVLGQQHPAEVDPGGTSFTFEKGAAKSGGGGGFADVWKRSAFAWEYKGKHKDLTAAYKQLLQYREDLENPPLLIVCDFNRFEVHTNFTGTIKRVYAFTLDDLLSPAPLEESNLSALDVLRAAFASPERLRPQQTVSQVTEKAAQEFARLSSSLRKWGHDPEQSAHFLMRLLFCLFAEDIGLLPPKLFSRLVEATRTRPKDFAVRVRQLFSAMSTGGSFGADDIAYFNGGLFEDDTALELTTDDLMILSRAAALDWSSIEPAIFGTLFERSLDPSKRSQLGAHYTSREDILLIVEPVLMEPLRRRWLEVQGQAQELIARRDAATERGDRAAATRTLQEMSRLLTSFAEEIASVRVLDPACGSGNFLYVALKRLLDLEKEVSVFAASNGLSAMFPAVSPTQLHGIELNPYAHALASVVVWIGYIQWLHDNGFGIPSSPILKPLHNILEMDAILAYDEQGKPVEPEWPQADVIIGNPPFLGGSKMRRELGDDYIGGLWKLYDRRVPAGADLVCYWFDRAREQITGDHAKRVGLLATQTIRRGGNQQVLSAIKRSGDIFLAWSNRPWVLNGADVRVALVGFDNGTEQMRVLDGKLVTTINPDLSTNLDLTHIQKLPENAGIAFIGDTKKGAFDIENAVAERLLREPMNPNQRPNSDVVVPWINAYDVVQRPRHMWIIDFGTSMSKEDAAMYERPFAYVEQHVKPERDKVRNPAERRNWWIHGRPALALRNAVSHLEKCIVTPEVAKYRLFAWEPTGINIAHKLYVFAREDDYFFGMLHSRLHEVWS
ncbi:MAG: N-6 DNA methylase, partial [Chloroflexota bacterium]|nr:N-6 DNA methylase [Chloroflexota bacterium]